MGASAEPVEAMNGHTQEELDEWLLFYVAWDDWHNQQPIWAVPCVPRAYALWAGTAGRGRIVRLLAWWLYGLSFRYAWWRSGRI